MSLDAPKKNLALSLLSPIRDLYTLIRYPLSCLFSSCLLYLSQPLLVWRELWSFNHLCSSLLSLLQFVHIPCSGEPSTGHIIPGRISPVLSKVERLLLSDCRQYCSSSSTGGHWPSLPQGLIAGSCSTRIPRSLSSELLSSWSASSLYRCMELFHSRCRIDISLSSISWGSCWPTSSDFQGPSGWQHNHQVCQPFLPILYQLQNC